MKKSDLRTGMRAETRNGSLYIVLKDYATGIYGHQEFVLAGTSGFLIGSDFNEELTKISKIFETQDQYDIVRVYECYGDSFILDVHKKGSLLWARTETKEMTVEEIQEALGYKIKVVESKK